MNWNWKRVQDRRFRIFQAIHHQDWVHNTWTLVVEKGHCASVHQGSLKIRTLVENDGKAGNNAQLCSRPVTASFVASEARSY